MKITGRGENGEEKVLAHVDLAEDGSMTVFYDDDVSKVTEEFQNPSWFANPLWYDLTWRNKEDGTETSATCVVLAMQYVTCDNLEEFHKMAVVGRFGHRVNLALHVGEWCGETFVHLAAQAGAKRCLKFLLFCLGPVMCTRQDGFHRRALDDAIREGKEACEKLLTFDIPIWLSEALDVIDTAESRIAEVGIVAIWLRCCNIQVDVAVGAKLVDSLRKNLVLQPQAIDDLAHFLVSAHPDYEPELYLTTALLPLLVSPGKVDDCFRELFKLQVEYAREACEKLDDTGLARVEVPESMDIFEGGFRQFFGPKWIAFARHQLRVLTQKRANWHTCAHCGALAMQLCSGCELFFYCSRDCSVRNWPFHRKDCRSVRLVAQCLESGKCTRTVTGTTSFPHRSAFECRDCDILVSTGGALCGTCASACHAGHKGVQKLQNPEGKRRHWTPLFCDCPETGCCKMGGK